MSAMFEIRPPVLPPTHNEFSIEGCPFFILGNQPLGPIPIIRRFTTQGRGKMFAANVRGSRSVKWIVGKRFVAHRSGDPFKPFFKGVS